MKHWVGRFALSHCIFTLAQGNLFSECTTCVHLTIVPFSTDRNQYTIHFTYFYTLSIHFLFLNVRGSAFSHLICTKAGLVSVFVTYRLPTLVQSSLRFVHLIYFLFMYFSLSIAFSLMFLLTSIIIFILIREALLRKKTPSPHENHHAPFPIIFSCTFLMQTCHSETLKHTNLSMKSPRFVFLRQQSKTLYYKFKIKMTSDKIFTSDSYYA